MSESKAVLARGVRPKETYVLFEISFWVLKDREIGLLFRQSILLNQ